MKTYCVLFVLSTVSYQCYGGLLDGILSGAHQTHNKVHDVANTFLGGLTQGLNVNFQGHFGVNNQQRPPQQHNGGGQSGKPGETVVIVVEEGSNYNQPRPGYNNRPQHHQPGYGGNNRPGYGNKPQYNNPGYGNPYQKPSYNNHGYGNGNWNGNYQPNNGNPNQNNYGQPNRPSYGNQGGQNNQYTTEFVTKEPEINTPHYGSINTPPNENNEQPEIPAVIEKTTKKPAEDKPLFVPLNPNEYNYGGDKIDVTAPKRETNDNTPKPAEPSDDDDFPIDIRFQNK